MHPLDFIIQAEGGFVNDPKDPGGATKYGISLRFLKTVDPALADLDQDGDVDVDDIFALNDSQARTFYMKYFYQPLKIENYPAPLGAVILDTAVNMGKARAVKMLQRGVNVYGGQLVADGMAGPKTVAAAGRVDLVALVQSYLLIRVFKYAQLCRKYPNLRKFFFGWCNRVHMLERFALQVEKESV